MNSTTPRLAATVMLARPASHRFELYMTRRSARSAFAPDAFVFPGGTVEAQDRSDAARRRTLGLDARRLSAEFRAAMPPELPHDEPTLDAASAAAALHAAVRELFEEAGILMARARNGSAVGARRALSAEVQDERRAVQSGMLTFAEFLQRHDWFADTGALTLFSHWITPRSEPRRYNTHFFFASALPEQAGWADSKETHDGIWIAPSEALERHRNGHFHLVYPTVKHLERLSRFSSLEEASAFAQAKPVVTIMPSGSPTEGFVMPGTLDGTW